ncbi:RlmE family RNA methyltransferase [Parvularcula oceani]|uniref:RlmE family RNA methyltransferase n=1 Tax=Parvularcula oceani TaxID=1247963 RepID=UPI0009E07AF5|nr:RlmE family RNA methyltransferase [Parvularcula oceani]
MAKPPRKPSGKSPTRSKPRGRRDLSRTTLGETPEKRGLKKPVKTSSEQQANRDLATKVKTARGRKLSSTRWLQRQLNDPFVIRAKAEGYRSRAAYKLTELDDKFAFLRPGGRIVDLGSAPGGWTQVAVRRTGGQGRVVGIDYLGMEPVDGADVLEMSFLDEEAPDALKALLGGKADVVMSDMAAPTTGHKATDHLRIIALAEEALGFAEEVLAPGGAFLAKVLQGGSEKGLLDRLKRSFERVAHAKPAASRADSAEMYVVATGFRADAAKE